MKLTIPEGKTPVSHLQELCNKWGIVPVYELVASEGPIHEPVFEYSVKVREYSAAGKGTTKKKAKHNAAESLLSLVEGVDIESTVAAEAHAESQQEDSRNGCSATPVSNPISQLQELIQKRRWPPPVYEFTNESGPLHARSHTCTIHLLEKSLQGSGSSKKLAKKDAALAMLQYISDGGEMLVSDDGNKESGLQSSEVDRSLSNAIEGLKLCQEIATLTPQHSREINSWYQGMKLKTGKTLASLQTLCLNIPATNYCQMLAEIAEEQGFSATYDDIAELTEDEQYQCIVQLSDIPAVICYSTGSTLYEAHSMAAHNALQYLKIMTRKV